MVGKDSIICKCKKAIGALKFATGGSSFKIKKRLAEAVIMSRILYAIQLWGSGATDTVIRKVQTVQNLTMTWITGKQRRTSTNELLKSVNWLSINQLVYYHGFLLIYKVRKQSSPLYNIRHLDASLSNKGRTGLTRRRWSSLIQDMYFKLEAGIRNEQKISIFKKKVKIWIKSNIGIFKNDD